MMRSYEPSLKFVLRRFCCHDEEYTLKNTLVSLSATKQLLRKMVCQCVSGTLISDRDDPTKMETVLFFWLYVQGSLATGVVPGFDAISLTHNIVGRIRW